MHNTYRSVDEFASIELGNALGPYADDYDIDGLMDALIEAEIVEHDPGTGSTSWADGHESDPEFWDIAQDYDVSGGDANER